MRRLAFWTAPLAGAGLLALLLLRRPGPDAPADGPRGAVEAADPRPEPPYNRAVAKSALNDWAGALADYDACLAARPDWPEAAYNRALAKSALNDGAGARADYDLALRLRPDWPEALFNRAHCRRGAGDVEGARGDLKRLLETAPETWPHRAEARKALASLPER